MSEQIEINSVSLSLATLRTANVEALTETGDNTGQNPVLFANNVLDSAMALSAILAHSQDSDSPAMHDEIRRVAGIHIADMISSLDVCAWKLGVNLGVTVRNRWNEVADNSGFKCRIGGDGHSIVIL